MNRGMKASKILEINPKHAIFAKLKDVFTANPDVLKEYADVLYDQALLIEGLPLEDPAAYARRIVDLMVNAAVPAAEKKDSEPVEAEIVE